MRIAKLLAIAVTLAGFSGCASQMALFKGSAKKTVVVDDKIEAAYAAAVATGKELGYSVSEKKNMVYSSRGMGYGEFSTVIVRFSETNGAVNADFDANSSKGSDVVLNEFVEAFGKRAKVR